VLGAAKMGYLVLAVAAGLGLFLWLTGRQKESPRLVSVGFSLLFLGVVGIMAWGVYLGSLHGYMSRVKYKAEAVRAGMTKERMIAEQMHRPADYHRFDQAVLKDEKQCRRLASFYGWDWETIE